MGRKQSKNKATFVEFSGRYKPGDYRKDSRALFLFGDNNLDNTKGSFPANETVSGERFARDGKGGQAQLLRISKSSKAYNRANCIGIVTTPESGFAFKKKKGNNYIFQKKDEINEFRKEDFKRIIEFNFDKLEEKLKSGKYDRVYVPVDGDGNISIGTGIAAIGSTDIYDFICKKLKEIEEKYCKNTQSSNKVKSRNNEHKNTRGFKNSKKRDVSSKRSSSGQDSSHDSVSSETLSTSSESVSEAVSSPSRHNSHSSSHHHSRRKHRHHNHHRPPPLWAARMLSNQGAFLHPSMLCNPFNRPPPPSHVAMLATRGNGFFPMI